MLDGERIFVAMFADQGVTIPKDTFVRGDAEQFGPFLKARINKKLRIETKRKKMKAERPLPKQNRATSPRRPRASSASRRRARRSGRPADTEGASSRARFRAGAPGIGRAYRQWNRFALLSSYFTSNLKSLRSGRSVIFIV